MSNAQQILNQVIVSMKNAKTQADADAWNGAVNLYQQLVGIYNVAVNILSKAQSILKSQMGSANNSLLNSELQRASDYFQSANNASNDAMSQVNDYQAFLKAKGILTSGITAYNQEVGRTKILGDKYANLAQEVNNYISNANNAMAANGNDPSWTKVIDLYRQAQSKFVMTSNIYQKMYSMITSQKPTLGLSLPTADATTDPFVDTNGVDEAAAGNISTKKDKQGRYLISVTSNQEDTDFIILAVKSGAKAIKFSATSDADGNIFLRTTRKLSGYILQLMLDNEVISKTKRIA